MAQEIPHDLTLSALKIEPSSISTNPVLDVNGNMVGYRRNVITLDSATDGRVLFVSESGSLINIDNSVDENIVVGLPTIEAGNVGTFYEFVLTGMSGNNTIQIQTGGHATIINEDNRTAKHDTFTGGLNVLDNTNGTTATSNYAVIANADNKGELLFDETGVDNNFAQVGTRFRCTAITASTTAANTKVWLLEGTLIVDVASNGSAVFVD